jgi:hypothetical protein
MADKYQSISTAIPRVVPSPPSEASAWKPKARHALSAIDLYSYRGYKTWIQNLRTSWEEDDK